MRDEASEYPLQPQFAGLGLDDQGRTLQVPLAGGADGDEESVLVRHGRLVAALLGDGERADGQVRLAERIGRRGEGVAAAEAAGAQLVVEAETRSVAGKGLVAEADGEPRGAEREDLVPLTGLGHLVLELARRSGLPEG